MHAQLRSYRWDNWGLTQIRAICKIQIGYLEQRLAERDITLEVTDAALRRAGIDPLEAAVEVDAAQDALIAAWRPMTRAWADLVWARAAGGA